MNRIISFLFYSYLIILPISPFVSVRLLVVVVALSLINIRRHGGFINFLKTSWDLLFYLLVITIGLIYSDDVTTGLKTLETSFGLLATPIICHRISNFDRKQLNLIFYFFSIGVLLASVICLVHASLMYVKDEDVSVFFFYNLTGIIDSHPTYLAYYLIFSITFALNTLNYERTLLPLWFVIAFIIFCFGILLLTGGQTAFVSLLLVFSYFILKFFLGIKSENQKLTIGLILLMMSCMFLVSAIEQTSREGSLNDSWDRFVLWRSAIDANPDKLFGVGTGDYKIVLNDYFRLHNLSKYADDSFNSHNQFIQIYFSNGLFGLLALAFILSRPLYLSFKNNNAIGILVFFPFLIYGITEVFLGRYQGIVFFALLHQVFVFYYKSLKLEFSLKED